MDIVENRKRLIEMGFNPRALGAGVVDTPEPESEEESTEGEQPVQEAAPEPVAATPEEPLPIQHNWEARFKTAQKALARKEAEFAKAQEALNHRIAELEAKQFTPEAQDAPIAAIENLDDDELAKEYPELSAAINLRTKRQVRAEVREQLAAAMAESKTTREEATEPDAAPTVFDEILAVYPNAQSLANEPAFHEWIDSLPARTEAKYRDRMVNTVNHDPEDVIEVLDLYVAYKAALPKQKAPEAEAPSFRPESNARSTPKASALKPLTEAELKSYNRLLAEATPEGRKTLAARMRLTLTNPR